MNAHHPLTPLAAAALLLLLAPGCRAAEMGSSFESASESGSSATDPGGTSSDGTETEADPPGGDFPPVLLDCPFPASLPFTTQSTAFENDASGETIAANARVKDHASDILGQRGGVLAHTMVGNTVPSSADLAVFGGNKLRTTNDEGLTGTALASEWVSLWGYDGEGWSELGRTQTNEMGAYTFMGVEPGPNRFQPFYAVLEGDGSCTAHLNFLLPADAQVVVTDIDGTLTIDDQELFTQISDGSYVPIENGSAAAMMRAWAQKGYTIVYLTARPHAFRTETRVWLEDLDYPVGPVISANSLVFDESARQYKRAWVNRIRNDFGWDVVAAYGNATSDIDAYEDAGIPKNITFIVGEHAGVADTVAIEYNDFSAHLTDFVAGQPDARPVD
jgi:hypothetical protein